MKRVRLSLCVNKVTNLRIILGIINFLRGKNGVLSPGRIPRTCRSRGCWGDRPGPSGSRDGPAGELGWVPQGSRARYRWWGYGTEAVYVFLICLSINRFPNKPLPFGGGSFRNLLCIKKMLKTAACSISVNVYQESTDCRTQGWTGFPAYPVRRASWSRGWTGFRAYPVRRSSLGRGWTGSGPNPVCRPAAR